MVYLYFIIILAIHAIKITVENIFVWMLILNDHIMSSWTRPIKNKTKLGTEVCISFLSPNLSDLISPLNIWEAAIRADKRVEQLIFIITFYKVSSS